MGEAKHKKEGDGPCVCTTDNCRANETAIFSL